jgi:hypothetical protein
MLRSFSIKGLPQFGNTAIKTAADYTPANA